VTGLEFESRAHDANKGRSIRVIFGEAHLQLNVLLRKLLKIFAKIAIKVEQAHFPAIQIFKTLPGLFHGVR